MYWSDFKYKYLSNLLDVRGDGNKEAIWKAQHYVPIAKPTGKVRVHFIKHINLRELASVITVTTWRARKVQAILGIMHGTSV